MARRRLSVVVVAFDMARELPRTIRSLSPGLQLGVDPEDYEIVVVDNGSTRPFAREACTRWGADVRFLRVPQAPVSPAPAVNRGLEAAEGELIGVMIDGARMASPGLLEGALLGARLHHRPVIASLGFHLGPDIQRIAMTRGYDQAAEDRLLDESGWTEDGYRLFDVATLAGSSSGGWFAPIAESSALFLPRDLWTELRGFDERFVQPGGGLVNVDAYTRACALPGGRLVVLLGEGTFHQMHGGVMTNSAPGASDALLAAFRAEYLAIRGRPVSPPDGEPLYLGRVRRQALPSIARSAATPGAAGWRTGSTAPPIHG